jgi:hypothetical protein
VSIGKAVPASVAKTWSFTRHRLSPLARAILGIAAWFAPDAIPRGVFAADRSAFSEALVEMFRILPSTRRWLNCTGSWALVLTRPHQASPARPPGADGVPRLFREADEYFLRR